VRELAGSTQKTVDKRQSLFNRQQMIIGQRQGLRQYALQSLDPISATHPTPEGRAARVRTQTLVGEADRN
jgi:hypothetical protein